MPHPYKILIQRADRLGDMVLALPVIECLKRNYPKAQIDVLASSIGTVILTDHPLVHQIHTLDLAGPLPNKNYWQTVNRIREERYDCYISLWNNPLMAWLGFLAKIPVRIGDASNPSLKWLYRPSVRQNWDDYTRHQLEFNMDLLKPLNLMDTRISKKIYLNPISIQHVKTYVQKCVDPNRKTVLIFMATGGSNFSIPKQAILDLIPFLERNGRFNVFLCGPQDESITVQTLGAVHNLLGKTTLPELFAFINFSDFYIGPDTGPSHVAAFLNKPMIIFSSIKPSSPTRWGPWTEYLRIIRKEYACQHKFPQRCEPNTCFSYVTGELLYRTFTGLLESLLLQDNLDEPEQKKYHLLQSARVLYVMHSRSEYEALARHLYGLQSEGLVVVPIILRPRWYHLPWLIRIILEKNINIIQGAMPKWMVKIIRWYIGFIKQYIRPIYAPQTFHSFIYLEDHLAIYQAIWQGKKVC